MTNQVNQSSSPPGTDIVEPNANWRSVPVWLLILIFLLIYWGMVYFDQHGGWFSQEVYTPFQSQAELALYLPPKGEVDIPRGHQVFDNVCALCHNTDGEGKPAQAPPLAGSEWVVGSPARLIRIPLYGLNGPITVKGQKFVLPGMPAMGAGLSDDDLANVLSYMRQAWGNKASPITPTQIKAVKEEVGSRVQAYTPEELPEK